MPKVSLRKIGAVYHLTWRIRAGTGPDGAPEYRQRSETASADRRTAELLRAQKQLEFDRVKGGLPVRKDITWEQCWRDYQKAAFERLEEPDTVMYALQDFNAKIKLYGVQEFDFGAVDRYARLCLQEGRAPGGVRRYVGILASVGKYIRKNGILSYNPVEGISPVKGPKKAEINHLNDAEIEVFLGKAWGKYLNFGSIGLYTGFRPGEILMTGFSDIDLTRDIVRISEKKKYDWHPKTYEQRTVKLPGELRELIVGWKKKARHELLVCNDDGSPMQEHSMGSLFRRVLKPKLEIPHLIPYVFRHTFAAKYLFENPGKIYQLSKILGHRSVRTTQDHYEHLVTGYAAEGMEKISFKK